MLTESQPPLLPWKKPGWLEEASEWIAARLEERDIQLNGPVEQIHVRPWSTVLSAPTFSGTVFMKASAPVLAHEPGLTQALSRWRPDCIQSVWAVDLDRELVRLALLVLAGGWYAWFVLLSVGVPRYLFPATFIGSIFVAALLYDLTDRFSLGWMVIVGN